MRSYPETIGAYVIGGQRLRFADALAAAKATGKRIFPVGIYGQQCGWIDVRSHDGTGLLNLLLPDQLDEKNIAMPGDIYATSSVYGPLCLV